MSIPSELLNALKTVLMNSPDAADNGLSEALVHALQGRVQKPGYSLSGLSLDKKRNAVQGNFRRDYDETSFNEAMKDPNWDEDTYMNLVEDLMADPDVVDFLKRK